MTRKMAVEETGGSHDLDVIHKGRKRSAKKETIEADGKILGDLDALVAFQLRIAQAASFQAFAALTGHRGLRPGYYAVLQVIADNPGIGQTELSRVVGRDKTTLTPMLKDMQRAHLIDRQPHPEDRRGRMLSLTVGGRAVLAQLAECAHTHDARLDTILGAADKQELLRLLKKVVAGLDRFSR